MKKAFTLIELLVVIAIIAILAAILFPVFAQAKQAAKKTASLSNIKQTNLGAIMYMGDSDDVEMMHQYHLVGSSITTPGGNTITDPEVDWPYAIQPYTKNWQILRDPGQNIDAFGCWAAPRTACGWYYNWMRWPEYGINVDYLNNAGGDCSGWAPNPGITEYGLPINASAIASPAATVFTTTTKVVGDSNGYYISNTTEAPASVYANDVCTWSNGGWGDNSYGDSPGLYAGNPTSTGTFSTPYAHGGNVSWCDGHASFMQPGRLAAGTDWHVGISNQITITDRTQYLWDTQQ
jgi:prepilin-type N-terminal cleavage/methylation domain-containing protein/prepilin-type processing-associated H-X9-DG protein